MSVSAITASVCCIALFKAFAACCYTLDGKLIEATVAGGEAVGGLWSLLPGQKSDTPEKQLKPFLDGVAQDIKALAFTDGPERGQALLNSLHNEGTRIVSHNVPTLAKHLVEQKNGDWRAATALVLANIPSGMDYKPFRGPGTVEREALTKVLDAFHQAMLAPKSLRDGLQMALAQDTNKTAHEILDLVKKIAKGEDASEQIAEKDKEIEGLKAALADLQSKAAAGNNRAGDALEEIAADGDTEKAIDLYFDRSDQNVEAAVEDLRRAGALAFYGHTDKALKAYTELTRLAPDDADGWNRLGQILARLGRIDEAVGAYQTVLRLGEDNDDARFIAAAHGNLGLLYRARGDLEQAEEAHKKSLEISKDFSNKEIIADQYGNLGILYRIRGELDKAEEAFTKSLKINEDLGRKEGMASDYGNLGNLYLDRDELDKAEEAYTRALRINEELGHKEGMANQYGNLGIFYRRRGELDKAEEAYTKSLKIEEELGRKEGMASDYGNLGVLYRVRDDLKTARSYWQKSLALFEDIGMPHRVEKVQGWLDGLND
ncbi:MAG: tetratricopeptide repeat protein [Pseudomonadota bacterium]